MAFLVFVLFVNAVFHEFSYINHLPQLFVQMQKSYPIRHFDKNKHFYRTQTRQQYNLQMLMINRIGWRPPLLASPITFSNSIFACSCDLLIEILFF